MSNVAFFEAINIHLVHGNGGEGERDFAFHQGCHSSYLRFMSETIGNDKSFLRKEYCTTIKSKKLVSCASKYCLYAQYPISASSVSETGYSPGKEKSMWNEKNLFTGCVDVPLTERRVEEAIEAGKRISKIPLDIIYTSALIRSQMTAILILTEHHLMKVPIIIHNVNEQARIWSQICSEDTKKQTVPVVKAWQLNERMYGNLQGFNKQRTAEQYGKDQVQKWRRRYDVRPPNGESLEMCLKRAVTFFKEHIEPQLLIGKHVMVVAHANSLRSMFMYLDKLTCQEVIDLELSTGVPMLYIYKEGKFIRRGSPLGSTEAGVYACTEAASEGHRFLKGLVLIGKPYKEEDMIIIEAKQLGRPAYVLPLSNI